MIRLTLAVFLVGALAGTCLVGASPTSPSVNRGPGFMRKLMGSASRIRLWSFSQHVTGICSQGHGGVQQWLVQPAS